MFFRDILPFLALILSYQQDTFVGNWASSRGARQRFLGIRACCCFPDAQPTEGEPSPIAQMELAARTRANLRPSGRPFESGTAHGRYVTRRMAEVAVWRQMFADIPSPISGCGHRPLGTGLVRHKYFARREER